MIEIITTYFSQAPEFGINAFWISQGLIAIALVFDITSYQLKQRQYILSCFTVSTILIGIHLYLLGETTAAALIGVAAVRFLVSIFTTNQKLMYGFLTLSGVIAYMLYSGPLDLLALICSVIFTIASFRKTDKALRQTMMCGTSLWIIYNVLIFSPAAIVLETFFLSSNLVGYYRFYIRGRKSLT